MVFKATASANAALKLNPQGSQIVLTVLGLLAAASLLIAAYLLVGERQSGWAFLFFALFFSVALVWCWHRSQRYSDLHNATATAIVLRDGTSIKTDSRLLLTPDAMQSFGQLIETLGNRQPLPPPAGFVAKDGTLVEGTAAEAQSRIAEMNAQLAKLTDQALSGLRAAMEGKTIEQQATVGATSPPPYEPAEGSLNAIGTTGTDIPV